MLAVVNPCIKTSVATYSILSLTSERVFPGIYEVPQEHEARVLRRADILLLRENPLGSVALILMTFRGRRARHLPPPCVPLNGYTILPRNTKRAAVMLSSASTAEGAVKDVRRTYRYAEAKIIYADPVRDTDVRLLATLGV